LRVVAGVELVLLAAVAQAQAGLERVQGYL
jgi:hypothetical protein